MKQKVYVDGIEYIVDNVDNLSEEQIRDKAEEMHDKSATSRNLKGFATSVGQGLTFNNGKRVYAALRTAMKHWGDSMSPHGEQNAKTTDSDYEGYKNAYETQNKDFAKKHKGWNVAGQVVGGILPAMIPLGAAAKATTLGGKVIQGAKSGGIIGGLYGAGEGLNEAENLLSTEALGKAASGLVKGGLMGTATGGVTAALGHFGSKAIDNLKYKGARGRVNQSIENIGEIDPEVAAIRQDNPHVASEFQRSVLNSEDSAVKADALFDKLKGEQSDHIRDEIANKFGVRTAKEHAGVINKRAEIEVSPKYEKLGESGRVDVGKRRGLGLQQLEDEIASKKTFLNDLEETARDPNYAKLIEKTPKYSAAARETLRQEIAADEAKLAQTGIFYNPRIQKTIADVKKRFSRLDRLADNDAKVLIEVDKVLNDQKFNLNNAQGHLSPKETLDKLEINELHNNFRNFLDSKLPGYKEAREAFQATKAKPMDAMEYGQKFSNLTTTDLNKALELTANNPHAQHSFEVGMGDTLRNQLLNAKSEDVNLIGKMFNDNTLRKMDMFGIKPSQELIQERNVLTNIGKALGNSKTAHALAQDAKRDFANIPKSFSIKSMVNKVINASNRETAEEAARIMYQVLTDPKAYAHYANWSKLPANRALALKLARKFPELAVKQGGHYGAMRMEGRN
ncbi:hypothetical protein FACS189496_2180 [Bacilli bacterium]|nr:hypothetical protein FACS189496_2180 [Bacilli bacterium]